MLKPAVHKADRWRYFINTCWVSLTAGFLIYVFTLLLDIPYGWAALLLFVRAAFWSIILDINNLNISIANGRFSGPGLLATSAPKTILFDAIVPEKIRIRNGRFFVEDSDDTLVTARLFWYPPDARESIEDFLDELRRRTIFSTVNSDRR